MSVEIVVREETSAVTVNISDGERLRYRLTVRGAVPLFALTDEGVGRALMNQDSTPVSTEPQLIYERRWPRQGDKIVTFSDHTLGMSFLAAVEYTYEVSHLAADGSVQATLIDMDFISSSAEEQHFQNLLVNLE